MPDIRLTPIKSAKDESDRLGKVGEQFRFIGVVSMTNTSNDS